MAHWARRNGAGVALLIVALVACGGDDSPSAPAGPPRRMIAKTSAIIQGVAGMESPAPVVQIVDRRGKPIRGALVRFNVTQGGGSVANGEVTTDDGGIATAGKWRLGVRSALNVLFVLSDSAHSLSFSAFGHPGAPAALKLNYGDKQVGFVNSIVNPPSVRVVDTYENGVPGASVTFAGTNGLEPTQVTRVTSNNFGSAMAAVWTLGATPGTYTVTASLAGVNSIVFTAIALDSTASVPAYELTTIDGRSPSMSSVASSIIFLAAGGLFIENTQWTFGQPVRSSGRYTLRDSTLTLDHFSGGNESGTIVKEALTLKREDYYYAGLVPWLYLKRR